MFDVRDLIPWSRNREITRGRREWEHPLVAFQRDMDRLFEDLWRGFDLPTSTRAPGGLVSPRIDVRETDEAITVSAELPGLDDKDVDVVLSEKMLTLKGEKKIEHEETEKGYNYRERSYGAFERRIPLDTDVLEDRVEASFKNGVLTVTLPKSPEAKKHFKRVEIKGSAEGATVGGAKAAA